MSEVEIFSAEFCPYAQRSRLALIEKGVDFSLTEINLRDKPDWFEDISPYSKVPVIRHQGKVIYESAVINEYLEEVFPEPPLMPSGAYERAWARIWVDYANNAFMDATIKLMMAKTAEDQEPAREECLATMRFMETEGLSRFDGPYWLGADVSLVDINFYPYFERMPALTALRGVDIPKDCPRLKTWVETMAARDAVKSIAHDGEFYIGRYRTFLDEPAPGQAAE